MAGLKLSPGVMAVAGLSALALVGVWVWSRGGVKQAATSLGYAVGSGVVGAVDGAVGGTVQGIGELFGVPRTDTPEAMSICAKAKADGDTWAVSQHCPATDFLSWWWKK